VLLRWACAANPVLGGDGFDPLGDLWQEAGLLYAEATRTFRGIGVAKNVEGVDGGRPRSLEALDFVWEEGFH
jgi:hypothetical protein